MLHGFFVALIKIDLVHGCANSDDRGAEEGTLARLSEKLACLADTSSGFTRIRLRCERHKAVQVPAPPPPAN